MPERRHTTSLTLPGYQARRLAAAGTAITPSHGMAAALHDVLLPYSTSRPSLELESRVAGEHASAIDETLTPSTRHESLTDVDEAASDILASQSS